MALVSEGLGLKQAETTSSFLKQMAILLAQAIKDGKKKGYMDEHMKGAKAILKHIQNGKQTAYQIVDTDEAAIFEKLLQNRRVPYVRLQDMNGTTSFVTRDTDKAMVDKVWELLANELKVGFKELSPHEFIQDNAGSNICQTTGYSEVELEVFRKEASKIGFTYAVVGNEKEKGKYDILYSERDKDIITKALKGLEYELSGDAGKEYQQKLDQSIAVKNQILQATKQNRSETIYLVNAKNPMNFITITDGVMIKHSLALVEKKNRDGSIGHVVKDTTKKTHPFGNRELTLAMKSFGTCKQVTKEDMSFISGFDSAGSVLVSDVSNLQRNLTAIHQKKDCPTYEVNLGRAELVQGEKLLTLSNLDTSELMELTAALDKENIPYIAVGSDIAYKQQDKAAIEKVLDRTIYKNLTFSEKFQTMLYFEGRGPEAIDLKNLQEPVYITSATNPDFMLKVSNEGYSLLKNGEAIMSMDKDNPQFEHNLEQMLGTMENVAVITVTEAELSAAERVKLIEDRASVKENSASKEYQKSYEERKEQFLNTEYNSLLEEDKKIVQRYMDHETTVTYVDRSFSEKITDMDLGTKMKEQTKTQTRTTHSSRDEVER